MADQTGRGPVPRGRGSRFDRTSELSRFYRNLSLRIVVIRGLLGWVALFEGSRRLRLADSTRGRSRGTGPRPVGVAMPQNGSPDDLRFYARSAFTTFAGSTPVSFESKPCTLTEKRSWWMPSRWRMVAWKSRTWTGSLTML
jgi:hypothetical protein